MVLKENSIVCARTENMAYQIREKCKQSGLNPKYINNVNDLFKYLITNRPNLIIVEKTLEFYKDIFIAYLDNFCKDCIVVFVGDRDEVVDKNNSNFYYSIYTNLYLIFHYLRCLIYMIHNCYN